MRFVFILIGLILPYFLFADSCLLMKKGAYPNNNLPNEFLVEIEDKSVLGKAKDYLFSYKNDLEKITVYVELNKSKCTNPEFPLFVEISNNSNFPIDRMRIEIGSFLEKKNGNSFFVEKIRLNLQDSKHEDFYIQSHSSHTFCAKAPHEDWTYKDGLGLFAEPVKENLIHSYNIDELKYYLLKKGCFVGFHNINRN